MPLKDNAAKAPAGPRILLVENHSLIGAAVGGLLGSPPLAAHVETVLDTQVAMARLGAADFDLVMCKLSDPPSGATELVATLAASGSKLPVVFLADTEQEHLLIDTLTSGATGFFTMDCSPGELMQGLSSVLQGNYTVGSRLKPRARARLAGAETAAAPDVARDPNDDSRK